MWFKLGLLAVPLVEIALFVLIGGLIGVWLTLAWVILTAALGIILLKRASRLGAITLDRGLQALRLPLSPLAQRVLQVLAGILLILPGFFTDALGLLLLLPPAQFVIIKLLMARLNAARPATRPGAVVEGDWHAVDPDPDSRLRAPDRTDPPSEWTRH